LQLARKAVDELYTQLAEEMQELPRMQPLQRKFLLQALEFYKVFAQRKGADPETRFETGRAYHRAGNIHDMFGQRSEAEQAQRQAIALFQKLLDEFPNRARYRADLASASIALGSFLIASGQTQRGIDAHRYAISLMEPLVAASPTVHDYQARLSSAYRSLGLLPGLAIQEAEKVLRDAIRLDQKLVAEFPDQARFRFDLADGHYSLGFVLAAAKRYEEAENAYRDAIVACKPAAKSHDSPSHRWLLAVVHLELGNLLAAKGRTDAADAAYRRAIALLQKQVTEIPDLPYAWAELARADSHLAAFLERAGRHSEAIEAYEKAGDGYDHALARSPDEVLFQLRQVDTWSILGRLFVEDHRPVEAKDAWKKAAELFEKVAARIPGDPILAQEVTKLAPTLADNWNILGVACYCAGDYREAIAALEKSEELGHGAKFSFNAFFLAMAHSQLGDKDAARECYDQAVQWMDKNKPNDGELRRFRAEAEEVLQIKARAQSEAKKGSR
jgi:tetratricopeptide (TPR) repeat protein